MMYPLVKELASDGIGVAVVCRVLKLSGQPYYRWLAAPITTSEIVQAYRANALFDAHRDEAEFGHRLLADEVRQAGQAMADRTAWRITSDNGWFSAFGKKRAKNGKKPGPAVHDDRCVVVDQDERTRHVFAADGPNELWLVDITEHKTAEGKLYLCAIKDAFSGRIVGYSIDSRMKSRLAVNALNNAVAMRGDVTGCVIHSNRGSQFRNRKFLRALTHHHMIGSMGRVGSSGDNAAMESFFALLQKNVLDRRTWATREQLRIAIVTWIERTYHRRRRQRRLGRLTPIEYETTMTTPATPAA
jgi:putative transposase